MRATLEAVRLTVELATAVAVVVWGAQATTSPLRWVVAAASGAALLAIWGRLIAPKSPKRLADPMRLVAEVAVFLAAGAAISVTFTPAAAIGFTLLAITDAIALRTTAHLISPSDCTRIPTNWEAS